MKKKLYDPCPICMENEIIEFRDWHSNKFHTEVYTYFCDKCGIIAKKEVDLLAKANRHATWVYLRSGLEGYYEE